MIPVYCIHLPDAERKAHIEAELARVGLTDVTYIHAREPFQGFQCSNMRRNPRGEFGCALSHLKAISRAIQDGCFEALFLEDDIVFTTAPIRPDFLRWRLPGDWRIAYLGGHPRGPARRVADGLVQISTFACTEGYLLSRRAMHEFLQFWCDRAGQPNAMIDFILGEYAAQGGGYAFYPTLTQQRVGYSYIGQKIDNKRDLENRAWAANLA